MWGMGVSEEKMAEKLEVKRATITRDKRFIRGRIKDQYSGTKAQGKVVEEMILTLQATLVQYWKLYANARLESTKTGALNGIARVITEKCKILQSMGVITNDLGTLTTKTITPDSLMELLAKVGGALPEDQRPAYFASIKKEMGDKDDDGGGGSK